MAINQNHPFEDLDGVKCAVVEKNVTSERVSFLKDILESNGFTVVVVASPPPKGAPVPDPDAEPITPSTFTVGVTDVSFNTVNALFGRLLRTREGRVVTNDFWYQRSAVSDDSTPYFSGK
ncbi:MAG: hypothetical protein ACKOQ6_02275 [Bacteroidota bacterium]